MIKISGGMLIYFIELYITDNDWESDETSQYLENVLEMKASLIRHNDLEPFRLGIDYILCHTEIDMSEWIGNAWTDFGVREAIKYIRKIVYNNQPPLNCEEIKNVLLIEMGQYEWWKMRTKQGLHPDYSKNEK